MAMGRPTAAAGWRCGSESVGAQILVPGLPQWGWRQPERALVLFGTFASAMGVALFAWGTWGGVLLLAFAFGVHVISVADGIRQAAFPGFGRLVPWASASVGLGLGCYAPALAMVSVLAWPVTRPDAPREGYLIDRWAYNHREPSPGEWAWIESGDRRGPWLARVVATHGQAVSWANDRLQVGGRALPWPFAPTGWQPGELSFDVPEGQVLVVSGAEACGELAGEAPCGLRLVPRRSVGGRVWARLYPIWHRHLLR